METRDVPMLIKKFRSRECGGIASFLEFMLELDEDERTITFQLMLTKMIGTRESTVDDPLDFFRGLYEVQERNPPFINEGLALLNTACAGVVELWESTEHRNNEFAHSTLSEGRFFCVGCIDFFRT